MAGRDIIMATQEELKALHLIKHKLIDKRPEKPKQLTKLRYAFGGKRFVPPQDHIYKKFKIRKCA